MLNIGRYGALRTVPLNLSKHSSKHSLHPPWTGTLSDYAGTRSGGLNILQNGALGS